MSLLVQPLALFDSLENIESTSFPSNYSCPEDLKQARLFLQAYTGSQGTFNSYRREVERLLQWCHLVAKKTLADLNRSDLEKFILFCHQPPTHWIGTKKLPRFVEKEGLRQSNPEWRPFVVAVSKSAHRRGVAPQIEDFDLSQGATKELFAILGTFFNYLLQEEYVSMNPVALIRQKSKFIRRQQGPGKIRRLSELQWQYLIATAEKMAQQDPERHERTLFIISALYSLYLRISELAASSRWTPTMQDFRRDGDGNWWFTTVGKGNKQREIAVSDAMLAALKRWRKFLGLSSLPSPADHSPLLPKNKNKGCISSTNYLRRIVQYCFDRAILELQQDNFTEEAESLMEATVHWLRHTGISDDVKHRPREHVRDDAGHSSSATTDKYIDVERRERHRSAKNKLIVVVE